jgi:rsbT co-antagonist protein RsbR
MPALETRPLSPDLVALHRRVAECEAEVRRVEAERDAAADIVQRAPAFISRLTPAGEVVYINEACERILGLRNAEAVGRPLMPIIYPGELMRPVQEYMRRAAGGADLRDHELVLRAHDGSLRTLAWNSLNRFAPDGKLLELVSFGVDVTERKQAEAAHRKLQDSVIAMQQVALAELSTPLIPLSDRVVAMPLVGTIDAGRANQILETLLTGVVDRRARTAIIDVTGVATVDTHVADALLRAAGGVRLLGAEVILTGIRPEVAQTLVRLGVDLSGIMTCATLQRGIAHALRKR